MSERKVLNKYYHPDFNCELLKEQRKAVQKPENVRMMIPFKMICDICCNFLYLGTKYNMRKEICDDEDYLGIPIHRFYMKCTYCYSEISFKTDPKNHGYVCENGATRGYEGWKDARAAEFILKEIKEKEEEGNTMKFIENRTNESKNELNLIEAITEIKENSKNRNKLNCKEIIKKLNDKDKPKIILVKNNIKEETKFNLISKKIIKNKKKENKLVDISESD